MIGFQKGLGIVLAVNGDEATQSSVSPMKGEFLTSPVRKQEFHSVNKTHASKIPISQNISSFISKMNGVQQNVN